ncbi:MAG: zinc ribbon domain-containing protein [Bacillota bacterium]
MECRHCGKGLPDTAQRFCPWCGQELTTPDTPPAPPPQQQVFQAPPPPPPASPPPQQPGHPPAARDQAAAAAAEAKKVAGQVATEVQRALNDPKLRAAIPGRSLSIAGLALMALAILLSALPWFRGVGLFWSLVMLAGGALVAVIELQGGGVRLPRAFDRLPPALLHPLLPPILAGLVAIHAFLEFSIGIIPLIWAAAAGLLVYDQFQKSLRAPDSFGRYFDVRRAWYGYRRYIVIGAAICLLSLFMTWSKSSGSWSGGYDYRYSSYYGGYTYQYNFTKYYWPGWELSGRSGRFALFAVASLLSLVGWSAYRGSGSVPAWFNHLGAGLAGVALLFWVINLGSKFGVLVYLTGLLLIGLALAMIYQGKHTGEYDPEHLLGRLKK